MPAADLPSVSVIVPVLNEEAMLRGCLESIAAQDYPNVIEVVVADGGSADRSTEVASEYPKVVVVDNPRRSRPAGLNVALAHAAGDIIVRVDARTRLAPDYVSACVTALERSGAAIVGGPMAYEAITPAARGIAAAMMSRLGAGPAEFRRLGGEPRFVDTVYLGAFRKQVVQDLGGYDEWSGGNEDAELAFRAQAVGGVYLDPEITSSYVSREDLGHLRRQFYRYGQNRVRTLRKHPRATSWRQLAVPLFFLGLVSPWRRRIMASYVAVVIARGMLETKRDAQATPYFIAALPIMHFAWGAGFLRGLLARVRPAPNSRA
jgi:succinoglycan biosynthesis protein ExoA